MLSYRHGFHAGNFADCHKHAGLCLVLAALAEKSKPMSLLDAFAGAGSYALDSDFARKTGEAAAGIGRLLAAARDESVAACFSDYLAAIDDGAAGNMPGETLAEYPGSPLLMRRAMRRAMQVEDELQLLELHPADHAALHSLFRTDPQVHVHRRDAREGLPALLPMQHRRGLVLLDPPYERTEEYREVAALLEKAYSRWPQGVYALWYPLLSDPLRSQLAGKMKKAIAGSGIRRIYCHELLLRPQTHGMQGSGMLWINLPWQQDVGLERQGRALLQVLAEAAPGSGARASGEWLVGE